LSGNLPNQVIAEEVLGNARGHLETLEELVKSRSGERLKVAAP